MLVLLVGLIGWLLQFWYNTNFHSSLNKSPFEILYGHEPRHLEIWLKERKTMTELLKQQLLRAQIRMKRQADKKRMKDSLKLEMWFG